VGIGLEGLDMKGLGKRQKEVGAIVDVKRSGSKHGHPFHSSVIGGVMACYPSDGGPCDCFGDSVRWFRLPLTEREIKEVKLLMSYFQDFSNWA
jgi:hypothetical protein